MFQFISDRHRDQYHLGTLATRFRGTRDEEKRRAIAAEYAQTVDRLIQSGQWDEAPTPEEQLPDEWMPPAFMAYWYDERP